MGDSAVNESERLDSFESVDDRHVSEIFEDEFDSLDFVDLLPLIIFEAIHFFDKIEKLGITFFV